MMKNKVAVLPTITGTWWLFTCQWMSHTCTSQCPKYNTAVCKLCSANRYTFEHASQPRRALSFICLDGKGRWKGFFAQDWLFHNNYLKAIITMAGGTHTARIRGCHQSELFESVPILSGWTLKRSFPLRGRSSIDQTSFQKNLHTLVKKALPICFWIETVIAVTSNKVCKRHPGLICYGVSSSWLYSWSFANISK